MMPGDEYIPRLSRVLDRLIASVGEAAAWLNVALIAVIITQVILRYVFSSGLVKLEELQWHLYAVCIMIGLSYCATRDTHIRLDLLYHRFSQRNKEIIDLLGTVFLLMPMVIIVLMHSWPFVTESFRLMEASDSVVGLPYRWIVKSFLLIGFGLLGLAGVSRLIRAVAFLIMGSR
jgi:TRAP-type mannitol/chloroaromatic compound transport system permease small subunit